MPARPPIWHVHAHLVEKSCNGITTIVISMQIIATETMQTLTERMFELQPPGGIFDDTAIYNASPQLGVGARRLLLHRAVASGEVLRLKPGVYCLAARLRRTQPHPFVLAAMLHHPSQISFETALAYHGLIPEAVHRIASSTNQRSRSFATPLGHFEFRRVPTKELRAGVRVTQVEGGWAFVATPLRALADLLYQRREVSWPRDGLRFLTESLRIELDDLAVDDVEEVAPSINNKRVRRYLEGLHAELGRGPR